MSNETDPNAISAVRTSTEHPCGSAERNSKW